MYCTSLERLRLMVAGAVLSYEYIQLIISTSRTNGQGSPLRTNGQGHHYYGQMLKVTIITD
jgi:hypothetical protein